MSRVNSATSRSKFAASESNINKKKSNKPPQVKFTSLPRSDRQVDKENNNNLTKVTRLNENTATLDSKHAQPSQSHTKTSRKRILPQKECSASGSADISRARIRSASTLGKTPTVATSRVGSPNAKTTAKQKQTPNKTRTSMAAAFLGKTADGLASSPKKSHNLDHGDVSKPDLLSKKTPRPQGSPNIEAKVVKLPRNSPTPAEQVGKSISLKQPCIKQTLLSEKKSAHTISSPTVAKIPSDIVRHRVNNIQAPQQTPKSHKESHENAEKIGHIRKSLASVFEQRKSIVIKRKSYLPVPEDEIMAEDFSVTVAVRVRPFSRREIDLEAKRVVFMNGNQTVVTDGVAEHSFLYDHSFWSVDKDNGEFASQRLVYERLGQPLLYAAFDGYNTCLFAYGQTGSGKSYTIMGLGDDKGIVPRFCDEMFSCVRTKEKQHKNVQYHIQVSYFEIYNEKIHDLLVSSTTNAEGNVVKQVLRVREHPEFGPYIEGLSKFSVSSFEDVQAWLEVGNRQRATASTGMNDKSSRSHSVFTMNVVQTTTEDLEGEKHESNRRSQINLVDLAGSERSTTAGTSGQRLKEGASINKSLLTLGKVISSLSERSSMAQKRRKRLFVPYRDSTLTWILRESLGGNSRTAMIATISPASCHMEETLSTLRYAKQARTIVNLVKVNEDPNAKIIRELKAEIAKLKEAYGQNEIDPKEFKASLLEVSSLRQRLCVAEREKDEVQEAWMRKLEQSEKRKAEEINELKRAGVSFKVDNQLPNLVNLNEDPQLSELLLYMIKHGLTRIGKKGGDCDIQLSGALIAEFHCKISNVDEVVTIEPIGDAKTFVNGELIVKPETLHHGDRVIIGGDHFFRLNHPIEIQRDGGRKRNSGGKRKDFEFAKHELVERQNERLQLEIEEAQIQIKQEMMGEIEAAKLEAEQQISSQRDEYELEIQNLQAQLVKDQAAKQELETICEQAEVLHNELKVSRKNRNLKPTAQKQIDYNADQIKTQVLAGLEAERQKLAKEVERMQQRKVKAKVAQHDPSTTVSPLRLSLLLQEANNISKTLNKHTLFSRHDASDDQLNVMIRIHNTKLGIWTLWTLDKFEEKLEMMREAYNGESEGSSGSEDGEDAANIFYDPSDEWQEAYSQLIDTPTSSRNPARTSRRLTRRLSSLVLARASPALQQSLSRLNTDKYSPATRSSPLDGAAHISFCKRRIGIAVDNANAGFDSMMDKLLLSLHDIGSIASKITLGFQENEDYTESVEYHENVTLITMATEMLLSVIGFIKYNSVEFSKSSPSVTKLVYQVEKTTKKLAGHITKLLHGCHSGIEQMVNESSSKISQIIPNISKCGGAITIATNLSVSLFNENHQQKLSHRMKHAFLQGGDTFMRKILAGGINRLGELEKENIYADESGMGNLSTAVIKLLKMCMDLQDYLHAEIVREALNRPLSESMQELYEASLIVQERDVPSHYYQEYLQRTQTLIQEVGVLVDGVSHINAKSQEFVNNPSLLDELHYKAESLWRPTSRIADLCVKHEGLCAMMHDISVSKKSPMSNMNSNNNNSKTDRSSSPCESLCDCVYESARTVQGILREIIDFADARSLLDPGGLNASGDALVQLKSCDNLSTDGKSLRRKRLLPSSPPLLNSDEYSTSFVVKNTVAKWLQFADNPTKTSDIGVTSESVYV